MSILSRLMKKCHQNHLGIRKVFLHFAFKALMLELNQHQIKNVNFFLLKQIKISDLIYFALNKSEYYLLNYNLKRKRSQQTRDGTKGKSKHVQNLQNLSAIA